MELEELVEIPEEEWPGLYLDSADEVLAQLETAFASPERELRDFALEGIVRSFLPDDFRNPDCPTTLTDEEQGDPVDFQRFVAPVVECLNGEGDTAAAAHALWVLARHRVELPAIAPTLLGVVQGAERAREHWGTPAWIWATGSLFHVLARHPEGAGQAVEVLQADPELQEIACTEVRTHAAGSYDLQVFEPMFTQAALSGDPSQVPRGLYCLVELVKRGGDARAACEAVEADLEGFSDPLEALLLVTLQHLGARSYEALERWVFSDDLATRKLALDALTAAVEGGASLAPWLQGRGVKERLLAAEAAARHRPDVGRGRLIRCLEQGGAPPASDTVYKRML